MNRLRRFLENHDLSKVDILFIGEDHCDPTIRYELCCLATYLADNGFEFYGAEAPLSSSLLLKHYPSIDIGI